MDFAESDRTDSWIVRALRGSLVRSVLLAPAAAWLGLLASIPQALFTVGLCSGLLTTLTFAERWLTRRGAARGLHAIAAGLFAWLVAVLALAVLVWQLGVGYGALTWAHGPTAANEALLAQAGTVSLPQVLFAGLFASPVGIACGAYAYSWRAPSALRIVTRACLAAAAVCGLVGFGFEQTRGSEDAILAGLSTFVTSWMYELIVASFCLGLVGLAGFLEGRVFRTQVVRWDPDVTPGAPPSRQL